MRLPRVQHGHAFLQKLMLGIVRLMMRAPASGVIRTLLYRPRFFGKKMSRLTHDVMRGDSEWTVGERELFAAFVSRLNQCLF